MRTYEEAIDLLVEMADTAPKLADAESRAQACRSLADWTDAVAFCYERTYGDVVRDVSAAMEARDA